jgi:DNA/RNA endonuclease YhcR with UshA esterase domain
VKEISMRAKLAILIASAGILASALPVFAHHSFAAEYDAGKPVELKGVVTKMEWTNPHARFYLDVKDANGNVTNWNFELASPNVLSRNGWTRHSLKEGDVITVQGARAKDGSYLANARSVTLADGRKVFAGSATENSN